MLTVQQVLYSLSDKDQEEIAHAERLIDNELMAHRDDHVIFVPLTLNSRVQFEIVKRYQTGGWYVTPYKKEAGTVGLSFKPDSIKVVSHDKD